MAKYVVNCTILRAKQPNLVPGTVVDSKDLDAARIKEMVKDGLLQVLAEEPAAEDKKSKPKAKTKKGVWDYNEDDLAGKSLEDLNLLIAGQDPTVEPFETVEEAIGFLTQDA